MSSIFKSLQNWIKERRMRRNSKKDQALRERCIDYIARNPHCADTLSVDRMFKYIKNGRD